MALTALLRSRLAGAFVLAAGVLAAACSPSAEVDDASGGDDAITSNDGAVLEFSFAGEAIADKDTPARQAIVAQLQYVQGMLTTDVRANGQVGLVATTDVRETPSGAKKTIAYKASLPVVWPKGTRAPSTYDLPLPKDTTKLDAFNDKYDGKCGTNEYGRETFWHDFNPKASGCTVDDADVTRARAAVRAHPKSTTGKYPEYDEVWKDDSLDIVAVFGIISSNAPEDEGAREMESVIREVSRTLTGAKRVDNRAGPSIIKDATVTGKVNVGGRARTVTLNAILVEEVAAAGADFDERFGAASEKADLVVYSGHSGLGKNINGLARKARVARGKYQLAYLNGCQTFAYLGTALQDKKIAANADDPNGTKYLDVVANALPAYGDDGATTMTIYKALLGYKEQPKTYNQLLEDFSSIHLVAVFGEDDNRFSP
jgi:hypothetical protein